MSDRILCLRSVFVKLTAPRPSIIPTYIQQIQIMTTDLTDLDLDSDGFFLPGKLYGLAKCQGKGLSGIWRRSRDSQQPIVKCPVKGMSILRRNLVCFKELPVYIIGEYILANWKDIGNWKDNRIV